MNYSCHTDTWSVATYCDMEKDQNLIITLKQLIERDLFDKFIFGKPLILIDEMPRALLRKDA